jgi:RNA polymerase sigma-70 factor (ECF subfamily)
MTVAPSTDQVWAQLSEDLRRFIRSRVPDTHVADDLLQETFVRIHRNIGTLQQTDRLAAWVYQIARNVLHDHYRQKSGASVALLDEVPAVEDEKRRLRACADQWFGQIVQHLPDKYRDAVQLSEIEGLSHQEVADRLGLSLPAAKSRIQRGRIMLKGILDQCCVFHFDRRGNLMDYDPKPDRTVCLDCND